MAGDRMVGVDPTGAGGTTDVIGARHKPFD